MQPTAHIVVTELGPDAGERVSVEPLPPYFTDRRAGATRPANVTVQAVFCVDCLRLSLVQAPGRRCAGCQDKRDQAERWAELRRLTGAARRAGGRR